MKERREDRSSEECGMLPQELCEKCNLVCVCACMCALTDRGVRAPRWGLAGANFRPQMGLAKLPFLESPLLWFIIRKSDTSVTPCL